MGRSMQSSVKRPRVSIDVSPRLRRRLRLAAAKHDLTVQRYIVEAIEERLQQDVGDQDDLSLRANSDPVLAELWDNPRDAEYDRL